MIFEMPSYTTRQARWMLSMLSILIAWRLLSLDFASLFVVKDLSGNFSPTGDRVMAALIAMTGSNDVLKLLQIAVAILWIAGGWWRLRWLLAAAWMVTAMFNLALYHFLQTMFMFELPLALMAIAICWPDGWRKCFSVKAEGQDEAAAWLLRSWFAYTVTCYFFTGLSKLEYSSNWINEVGLAWIYPFVKTVEFMEFPPWLEVVAEYFHKLLMAHPWLDRGGAALALAAELAAPLALGVRWLRSTIPLLLAAMHFMLWLVCGMVFLEMGIVIFIFGCLHWRQPPAATIGHQWRWAVVTALATAVLLAVAPNLLRTSFPPFGDYRVFGWCYKNLMVKHEKMQYALGYLDQGKQIYRPLPLNYGGFKQIGVPLLASLALRTIVENPEDKAVINYNMHLLEKCAQSIRPHESNAAMLGWLAMPQRVTLSTPEIPLSVLMRNLFLLKGEPDPSGLVATQFGMVWKPIGEVHLRRRKPVVLY